MSDLNVNNSRIEQPQQQNEDINVQNQAPQEIANARPSKLSFALRIIAGIFTLGISEGVRFLVNKFSSAAPRENQVRPMNQDMSPTADPAIDQINTQLLRDIAGKNPPQAHKHAIEEVAAKYRNILGDDAIPEDINNLLNVKVKNNNPLLLSLRLKIQKSTVEVTPEILKTYVDDILKENSAFLSVQGAIKEDARKAGVSLDPYTLNQAVTKIMENNPDAKQIKTPAEAQQYLSAMPNGRLIIEQTKLTSMLSQDNLQLPKDHILTKALDKVFNKLKTDFKEQFPQKDTMELLKMKVEKNSRLYTRIDEAIQVIKNNNELTEQFLEDKIYSIVSPELKINTLSTLLKNEMEEAGIPTSNPNSVSSTIRLLIKEKPQFAAELSNCKSTEEVSAAVTKYSKDITAKLNEIKNNMTVMENTYLPQVHPEIKPILKQMIHALPMDNASKEKSENVIKEQLMTMKTWANVDSSLDFKGGKEIFNEFQKDLTYLEGTQAENESHNAYTDNIYQTFIADTNRATFIFNGEKAEKDTDNVIGKIKGLLTKPKDLQFVTKLCNQRVFGTFSELNNFMKMNGQYFSNFVKPHHGIGGPIAHVESGKSLMISGQAISKDKDKNADLVFDINISDDKKTGSLIFKNAVYIDMVPPISSTVGVVEYTLKFDFTLSSGNEKGVPTLDSMEVTQKFGQPF